jgi:long-chain acyl-CoA synthetase
MSEIALTEHPWPVMSVSDAYRVMTGPRMPCAMSETMIRGVPTRVFANLPPAIRDMVTAGRTHGEKIFLVHEDERVSFEAFHRAVANLAKAFADLGVVKGDRVAVVMRNLPEWVVAFYAGQAVGAIVTPLNAWWTGPELEYGLSDSGAKVLVADAQRFGRLAAHLPNCPDLAHVFVCRLEQALVHDKLSRLEDVIGAPNDWANLPDLPLPDVAIDADDDATIFYTSGTTGRPKGALGTQRNLITNIGSTLSSAQRALLRRGDPILPPDPNAPQRAGLLAIPFFHVTGCCASLNPSLFSGAKIVLMRKFDAEAAMALIEKEHITQTGGVPTIAWQIIEHPNRAQYDLSSLEFVSYGGAPSAPELAGAIAKALPGAMPGNGWGMTETSATAVSNSAEDYLARPDSAGVGVPVIDLKIMTLEGDRELPIGEVGELWCKGPQVVKGYWNNPVATAATFVDGWVKTGDLARLDAEGFLYVIDRAKDMLIRGGENIYCIEVENALYAHPAVMDAAIVGIPHRLLGEEPAAVVTLKPDMTATEGELRAVVAERLAGFKVPVKVLFWTEPLPRNVNGKILKSELKKLFV